MVRNRPCKKKQVLGTAEATGENDDRAMNLDSSDNYIKNVS